MKNDALLDFEISAADMETPKTIKPVKDYGDASVFPVYGGKMQPRQIARRIFPGVRMATR